jgi:hypothetical protein
VQELRDESKLEAIPRIMKEKNIDVYLIQETHLVGDFEKTLIDNFFMIHRGPEEQPLRGAKGGVAIVLSPELADLWKSSKKKQKIARGGTTIGDTTRILSISIRFKTNNSKLNKELTHTLSLITIYFPHSGYKNYELDQFSNEVSEFLQLTCPRRITLL